MNVRKRIAIGFDRTAWLGVGIWFHTETLWVDFFGFYLNLHLGRRQR